MRRLAAPLVLLLIAAIVAMLAFGLVSGDGSSAKKPTTATTVAAKPSGAQMRADAVAANGALLASVPLPADSRLFSKTEVEAPKGGTQLSSQASFAFAGEPKAVIEHFKGALKDWKLVGELTVANRLVAKFQKGDAWLEVAASEIEIAGKPTPGFTLTVNAKDAAAFAKL